MGQGGNSSIASPPVIRSVYGAGMGMRIVVWGGMGLGLDWVWGPLGWGVGGEGWARLGWASLTWDRLRWGWMGWGGVGRQWVR